MTTKPLPATGSISLSIGSETRERVDPNGSPRHRLLACDPLRVVRDNGPFRYQEQTGNFEAEVRIAGKYDELYHQAGLMIRLDERNWIKAGIEFLNGRQSVSAVVTREFSIGLYWLALTTPRFSGCACDGMRTTFRFPIPRPPGMVDDSACVLSAAVTRQNWHDGCCPRLGSFGSHVRSLFDAPLHSPRQED